MKSKEYNSNINGLRGACALAVMCHHIWNGPRDNGWFLIGNSTALKIADFFIDSFQFSVDIFFMISGYVIVNSLLRHRNVGEFYWNRFLRIYPVYFVILLLIFLVGPFFHYTHLPGTFSLAWVGSFLVNLALVPGLYPMHAALIVAWTLSYEWMFYIIVGLGYAIHAARGKVPSRIFLILCGGLFCWFYPRAMFFAVGASVFFMHASGALSSSRLHRLRGVPWILGMFFFLELFSRQGLAPLRLGVLGALAFGFLFFAGLVVRKKSILQAPVVQYFGTISYSFYMWHTVVMFGAKRLIDLEFHHDSIYFRIFLLGLATFTLSTFISHLSYQFIERKLTERIRKWADNSRAFYWNEQKTALPDEKRPQSA
jgi:peptidoglycan/LPS O-acetylase OafA/YrhL